MRPICLNYGCEKLVTHNGSRWRSFCARCHRAGYGAATLAEGVTAFKTGVCSNQNGQLGFGCAIDYVKAPWALGQTQIDHISGDYFHNDPINCMELCDMCHTYKGKLSGDFKRQNQTKYMYKRKTK
jgi:hypothetical protein